MPRALLGSADPGRMPDGAQYVVKKATFWLGLQTGSFPCDPAPWPGPQSPLLTVSSVQMECTWVPNITEVKMRKSSASKHNRMSRMTVVGGEKELHSAREAGTGIGDGYTAPCSTPPSSHPASGPTF